MKVFVVVAVAFAFVSRPPSDRPKLSRVSRLTSQRSQGVLCSAVPFGCFLYPSCSVAPFLPAGFVFSPEGMVKPKKGFPFLLFYLLPLKSLGYCSQNLLKVYTTTQGC